MIYFKNLNGTRFIRINETAVTIVAFGDTPIVKVYPFNDAKVIPFGECITCNEQDFDIALEAADDIMLSTQKVFA